MRCCALILLFFLIAETGLARPARVILLRHAEKPADESDGYLSERGKARARALAAFLTMEAVLGTNGQPAALFAPKATRGGHTFRPRQTLEPLGEHLRLSVQTPYGPSDYAALAKRVLSDPGLDGKAVVVCWIHDYLPALAKALGVEPKPARWKASVYDRLWIVTYEGHNAVLSDLPQNLLPGDSTK
ncbi:MAG: hypothetical protein ABSH34_09160 [Verrucomicrobiota bacterium]|jgi:hypothetical protein